MKIELGFRDTVVPVEVPDKNLQAVLQPSAIESDLSEAEIVRAALEHPIGTPRLREMVKPGQKVVIVTSDITRPMPTSRVMPYVLEELGRAGVRDADVTLVFATGVHRKPPAEECRKLAGDLAYSRIKCIGSDNEDVTYLGKTSRGTEVEIMRLVAEADFRICLGNIEFHYFAGFSGGAKAIVPGCAARRTIKANHSLMMDPRSFAGNAADNPVRLDLEEAVNMRRPQFILNVVLDAHKVIKYAVAGDMITAHRNGCEFLRKAYLCPIEAEADVVLASMGGSPKDLDLYQSQKAIDNAFHAVRPGGVIILVASCREGFGEKTFEAWFKEAQTSGDLIKRIKADFQLGGHKAAAIAKTLAKAQIWLYSDLADEVVKGAFLRPIHDVQAALDEALRQAGPDAKVIVMPYSGSTLPALTSFCGKKK